MRDRGMLAAAGALLLLCGTTRITARTSAPRRGDAPSPAKAALRTPEDAGELFVDPHKGRDAADGSEKRPLRSISAAIARLPDPVTRSVTIHLAAGAYDTTGGADMPGRSLVLWRRMRPGASVRLAGPEEGEPAVLAWNGDRHMVEAHEGTWELARLQVGSFSSEQRRGVTVHGPARVVLEDVAFRLRSDSDAGIWAVDGGRVELRGAIRLNEHLAGKEAKAIDESFCGILASDGGVVEYADSRGSLELGNGNLSARYYGSIRLGCASARVTCWTGSNNLTVNNGGRIDLRNTPIVLRACSRSNVPIGLEDDGHVLAEDARITIVGPNDSAIALQKASVLACNDIDLQGEFEYALWGTSGSVFVGRFLGDVPKVRARTGASLHIEKIGGKLVGPVTAESGGVVSLPDRVVRSE
jgi:hypothetical protein